MTNLEATMTMKTKSAARNPNFPSVLESLEMQIVTTKMPAMNFGPYWPLLGRLCTAGIVETTVYDALRYSHVFYYYYYLHFLLQYDC